MNYLSALISFVVPGSGQVWYREYAHGLIIFGFWLAWIFISKFAFSFDNLFVFMGWLVFSGYSAFDALIFNPRNIKQEDTQIEEFEEMLEERKKSETEETQEAKKLIETELKKKYTNYRILEMKKDKRDVKVKALINGENYELIVDPEGEITIKKIPKFFSALNR